MNKTNMAQQSKTDSRVHLMHPTPAQGILQRQCACGNHTSAGGECEECKKKKLGLQRKLMIGASNDPLEQEADRVADQVMANSNAVGTTSVLPRIQRLSGQSSEGVGEAPASVERVLSGSGRPLEPALQHDMETRFGYDFSGVRIHTGSAAEQSARDVNALAYTVGNDVVFGAGQFAPGSHEGQRLIAHELTHVGQQGRIIQNTTLNVIRRSPLSNQANAIWTASQQNKDRIFDFLRANSPTSDPDIIAFVRSIFAIGSDDLWLAETIMRNGAEPRWSLADITERQRRAMTNSWAPEPGNISATLGTGNHTVEAFYFRGTTERRALIIGGVHGSEPGGVEVVNDLLAIMRRPNAPMPSFTVIIVPILFSANARARRRASGGTVGAVVSGHVSSVSTPDPNRQFPAIGADPIFNAALGCIVDEQQRCIEPENLVLLDLINRFQPERVASVHGHSEQSSTAALLANGGPSITTDPRPGHEREDDALALSMATEAERAGVRIPGNFMSTPNQTTRYPTGSAPRMSAGVTFGQWGSHSTPTRPAMNIILIETFGNTTSASRSLSAAQQASRRTELMSLAQILRDFFLT